MKTFMIWIVVLIGFPAMAIAAEKPTSSETQKVVDYYYHGSGGGAVMVEAFLCKEIYKEGENKNECAQKVEGTLAEGEEAYLWMNFLIPVGEAPNIIVSFERNDKVRSVAEIKLKEAVRYRTWTRVPTVKAGTWNMSILQEMENQDIEFGELNYEVLAPLQ